jgi:hypothetical protein
MDSTGREPVGRAIMAFGQLMLPPSGQPVRLKASAASDA